MKYLSQGTTEIIRQTPGEIPPLPFTKVKDVVLGKKYELSLSFIGSNDMRELSIEHKGSPNHMNTLAFPLDSASGEIVMNLETLRRQAPEYGKSYHNHLLFMFIHSCLHLKGFKHGKAMELEEDRVYGKFKI